MPKFDLVLLDLDDTLIDSRRCSEHALFMACKRYNIPFNNRVYRRFSEIQIGWWQAYERGEVTQQQLLVSRFDDFLEDMNVTHVSGADMNRCHNHHMASSAFLNDGAFEVCEKLSKVCTLGIVSNGVYDIQKSRLASAGLTKYIKDIIVSDVVGQPKPSREFFDFVFERFDGFSRKQAIVVGDSLSADIKGAINANIASCWYNPTKAEASHDIIPKYEIANLNDLIDIIIGNNDNPLVLGF